MIPGPTPIPTRVLAAMNHDMIGHRGPLFSAVMKEVMADLKWAYETKNEIFIYPCHPGPAAWKSPRSTRFRPATR